MSSLRLHCPQCSRYLHHIHISTPPSSPLLQESRRGARKRTGISTATATLSPTTTRASKSRRILCVACASDIIIIIVVVVVIINLADQFSHGLCERQLHQWIQRVKSLHCVSGTCAGWFQRVCTAIDDYAIDPIPRAPTFTLSYRFWQMVWENNVDVIGMVTNEVYNSRCSPAFNC